MNKKAWLWILPLVLLLALPLLVVLGMETGMKDMGLGETLDLFFNGDGLQREILVDLILPRVVMALLSGAILTLGGFLMQALVKNPLADPYIMGLSAGAGFGVNLKLLGIIGIGAGAYVLPFFAFVGALLSLVLLLALGYRAMYQDSARLLIAGVAVSSLFMALTGLLIYVFSENDTLHQVIFWSFGSFAASHWEDVYVVAVLLALLWAFTYAWGNRLDLLVMGDRQAGSLGMQVPRAKLMILGVTALCVGGSIAYTGPIGFVGMMIPHFSRGVFGLKHRHNILFGSLLGGTFLLACDVLSQWIYPPVGLPIGVITALLGVPFFLYLLFGSRYKF